MWGTGREWPWQVSGTKVREPSVVWLVGMVMIAVIVGGWLAGWRVRVYKS